MRKGFLAFFLLIPSYGCRTLPNLDPDKVYTDTATIMRRMGDASCWMMIDTDHYGIMNTEMMDFDECRKWRPQQRVIIEVHDANWARIIRHAAP